MQPGGSPTGESLDCEVRLNVELARLISGHLPRVVVGGSAEALADRKVPQLKVVPPVGADQMVGPSGHVYRSGWEDDWEGRLTVPVQKEMEVAGFRGVIEIDTWGWDVDSSAEMARRASLILVAMLMRLAQAHDLDGSEDEVLSILESW